MKKLIAVLLTAILVFSAAAFAQTVSIAVPNDPTNEGRALLLLQKYGVITLKEDAGLYATKGDILSSTVDIEIVELDAPTIPNALIDVDYAIINSNYALLAGLYPVNDSLLIEESDSPYVNVLSVKDGNQDTAEAKALAAALSSQQVVDYINANWDGDVVPAIDEPTDGYDASVDYDALNGKTISIAASDTPHAEILTVVKDILAAKGITLDVIVVGDYITPNEFVENGDVFANYFAHQPYQDVFNEENGTHLVTIAGIHIEPLGLYGGRQSDLTALGLAAE